MKRLQYTWGYCAGVLSILLSLTVGTSLLWSTVRDEAAAEVIDSQLLWPIGLLIGGVFALPLLIAGIGILKRKSFGWNIFHVLIAFLIVFIPAASWFDTTDTFPWDRFSMGAVILDLILILFLFLQVRYWWRRESLYSKKGESGVKPTGKWDSRK